MAPNAIIMEGYGLTEASGGPLIDPFIESYKKKFGSVGIPLCDSDVKVINPQTENEVSIGESGEIIVRGPTVFNGYWNDMKREKRYLKSGWLYTNDIDHMDSDGIFYIEGRKDNMINKKREKIWPREIEKIIEENPKVKEVAIIASHTDNLNETIIKAYVVKKHGTFINKEELLNFCKGRLIYYKIPDQIEFIEKLPRNHAGKVLYFKLK